MIWIYLFSAMAIGVMFSLQPAINAAVARVTGSSLSAAALSIAISLCCVVLMLPMLGGGNLRPQNLATLPWWAVLAGVIGAFVVAGGTAIAPVTGAALFFVCVVTGQLVGAAAADHIGAFGLIERPFTLMRGLGIALVILGAILVQKG